MKPETTSKEPANIESSKPKFPVLRWALISAFCSLALAFLIAPALRKTIWLSDLDEVHRNANRLKVAISTYHTEYRKYPVDAKVPDAVIDSGHELMDVLLGSETAAQPGKLNPRRIRFYKKSGVSKNGLKLDRQGGGELRDPWGYFYRVQIDADGDGEIDDPETPGIDDPGLEQSILVWSAGPDGDFATWEDNQRTW